MSEEGRRRVRRSEEKPREAVRSQEDPKIKEFSVCTPEKGLKKFWVL